MSESIEQFRVSPAAARRITEIVAGDGAHAALRVEVLAGGCSGFQYRFDLTGEKRADDEEIAAGGAKVFVDPASLELLQNAELDFTEALIGAHFVVKNPNATSSCGCGTSFSID